MNTRRTRRMARMWLLGALMLGALIRIYLAWTASVVSRDGIDYLRIARTMAQDWQSGIEHERQAGFPALIVGAQVLTRPWLPQYEPMHWQRAGQIVSLIGGIACIPLVYWLGRRLHSQRVGLLAAWVWALLPDACRFSADVLTDMPYLAATLAGVALAMVGLRRRRKHWLFWAGLIAGAGYVLRAEAAAVVAVAAACAALLPQSPFRWRWTAPAVLVIGFIMVAGPYVWLENGEILSEKPGLLRLPIPDFASLDVPTSVRPQATGAGHHLATPLLAQIGITQPARNLAEALLRFVAKLSDSLNGVWLVLGALYLMLPGRRRLRRSWLAVPLLLWMLHSLLCVFLYMKFGYLSRRHVMLPDVGLVILAAATLAYSADYLFRTLPDRWKRLGRRADALVMAIIILALTPWIFRDINYGRFYLRDAARWLRCEIRAVQEPTVLAQYGWVPYYAGLTDWIEHRDPHRLARASKRRRPAWAIIDLRHTRPERLAKIWPARLRATEVARFSDADASRGVVVYRLMPTGTHVPPRATSVSPPPSLK